MLIDLAEHKDEGFISLKDVAERQGISKQYLEQIVSLLHSSNILRANRGKNGGYMLGVDPSSCTVGQVLRMTESSLVPVDCLEDDVNKCDRAGICRTLHMWMGLKKVIDDYLDNITLQDMIDRYMERGADNYVI
jgi:Rrf2 family protein